MSDFKKANAFVSAEIDDDSYIKEVTAKVLNDPEVSAKIKELGLRNEDIDPNLGKLLTYYEDLLPCRECPGLENCPKAYPRTKVDLYSAYPGRVERTLSSCDLAAREEEISSHFLYRDYPDLFKEASNDRKKAKNIKNLVTFARESNTDKPIVYVYGPEGSGVTYRLAAHANQLAEKGHTVAFIDAPRRLGELSDLFFRNKDAFNSAMSSLQDVDLLVIDNLGNEYVTEPIRDAVLLPLLTYRKDKGRKTFIGTSFTIDGLAERYGVKNRERGAYLGNFLATYGKTVKMNPGLQGN